MKNTIKIICLLISVLILFSSCQSVYVDSKPPAGEETKPLVEVDLDKEYFTSGRLRREVTPTGGCMYGDSWIFVETNTYERLTKVTTDGREVYHEVACYRIVKANAQTGNVSSICLDPVCTHSPLSECIAVAPYGASSALVQDIVGDWLMFQYSIRDKEYGLINESYVYNLKTGELINVFAYDVGDVVMTRWGSRCVFENSIFGVKNILDYSNTDYVPGKNVASDFTPETKSYICKYDFDTRESSQLIEIPTGYSLTEVTNKRFILQGEGHKFYSVDRDGQSFKELNALDFSPSAVLGRYAYGLDQEKEEFYIYDLEDNVKKTFKTVASKISYSVCDTGILKVVRTDHEEFDRYNDNKSEKLKEYIEEQKKIRPDVKESVFNNEFFQIYTKLLYSMGTVVYHIGDYLGEGEEVQIFEFAEGLIAPMHVSAGYLYCDLVKYDDTSKTVFSQKCFVSCDTGEITVIPLLDLGITKNSPNG